MKETFILWHQHNSKVFNLQSPNRYVYVVLLTVTSRLNDRSSGEDGVTFMLLNIERFLWLVVVVKNAFSDRDAFAGKHRLVDDARPGKLKNFIFPIVGWVNNAFDTKYFWSTITPARIAKQLMCNRTIWKMAEMKQLQGQHHRPWACCRLALRWHLQVQVTMIRPLRSCLRPDIR